MSQSYDVTSPDGTIGVNVVAEERSEYVSGTRLWVDIYKNDTKIAQLRIGGCIDSSVPIWLDKPITIDNKTTNSTQNYNELIVSFTDTEDNISADLHILVYNDMIALRLENISSGKLSMPVFRFVDLTEDEVIVANSTVGGAYSHQSWLIHYNKLSDIQSEYNKYADPLFFDLSKKFAVLPLTAQVLFTSMRVCVSGSSGEYRDVSFEAVPYNGTSDTLPSTANVSMSDWIGIIFFEKLYEIFNIIDSHIRDIVTVKEFNEKVIAWISSWAWYGKDIDENKIKQLADIGIDMGVNFIGIDGGWQSTGYNYDSIKFPNGIKPVVDYIHFKGLNAYLYNNMVNLKEEGVDSAINKIVSYGIGYGDAVKLGFVLDVVEDNRDNHGTLQLLREFIDRAYNNNWFVSLHEISALFAIAFEYRNVRIESGIEYTEGTVYDVLEAIFKYCDMHHIDLASDGKQGQATMLLKPAASLGSALLSITRIVDCSEWNDLDDDTKKWFRKLILHTPVNNIDFDQSTGLIRAEGDNIIILIATKDVNTSIDIPFKAIKITSGSNGVGLVTETVNQGTDNISLSANDGIIYVSTSIFSIVNYPSKVSGYTGEQKIVDITVENQGVSDGTVELRVKDHNGNVVASQRQTIPAGSSYTFSITITLPSTVGTYTWSIEAYNVSTDNVDDSKSFTVEVSGVEVPSVLNQFIQLFMQLLPFIILLIIVSLLVAALK